MILYEWIGKDGRPHRMVAGKHAIHPLAPEQAWELQVHNGRSWWAMVDFNAARLGVRGTLSYNAKLDAVDVLVEPYFCTFSGPCQGGHIHFSPTVSASTARELLWATLKTFQPRRLKR